MIIDIVKNEQKYKLELPDEPTAILDAIRSLIENGHLSLEDEILIPQESGSIKSTVENFINLISGSIEDSEEDNDSSESKLPENDKHQDTKIIIQELYRKKIFITPDPERSIFIDGEIGMDPMSLG